MGRIKVSAWQDGNKRVVINTFKFSIYSQFYTPHFTPGQQKRNFYVAFFRSRIYFTDFFFEKHNPPASVGTSPAFCSKAHKKWALSTPIGFN
jgi:hypothetical protein